MSRRTVFSMVSLALLALVLITFSVFASSPAMAASRAVPVTIGLLPDVPVTDNFGYQADVGVFSWVPVLTGTQISYSENQDDSYQDVPEIPIGFAFPFYENTYTSVSVSINGYLTLDADSREQLFRNQNMPSDQAPNAIIAPFWDDLVLTQTSSIYYSNGTLNQVDYFAVQWNLLTRFKESPQVTFQAVLFEDGDILFQYSDMNGVLDSATVGIEDGDGIDGLPYLYNEAGLGDNFAILFQRPPPGARGKLSPLYSGGFIIAGEADFNVTLKNTGDLAGTNVTDSYVFSWILTGENTNWTVQVYSGGQLVTNSGPLLQLESKSYSVKILPPAGYTPGDHVLIDFKATSQANPGREAKVKLQVAVPANFMHTYSSIDPGGIHTRLGLYWEKNVAATQYTPFTNNIALMPGGENYLLAWDASRTIYYNVINQLGVPEAQTKILASPPSIFVTYSFPSLANNLADSRVAIAWLGRESNVHNIWLSVIDLAQASPVPSTPENVTGNTLSYTFADGGVKFEDVSAVFLPNNMLLLTWQQKHYLDADNTTSDVYSRLYNLSTHAWANAPLAITNNTSDPNIAYVGSTMVALPDTGGAFPNNGTTLIFFTRENYSEKTRQVYWAAVSKLGVLVKPATLLGSFQGQDIDGVRLSTGKIALAWVSADRSAIQFTRLTPAAGPNLNIDNTMDLVLTNLNLVSEPSLFAARDDQNIENSIMTWKNADGTQIYYALVRPTDVGTPSTPPLMFASAPATILMSKNGQSSAFYIGTYRVVLPLTARNAIPASFQSKEPVEQFFEER